LSYGNIIYVNAANAGVQDGTSWAKAFKHLQDALETARRCNTVTQIWVAAGTYYPDEGGIAPGAFQPRGGLAIYGGFVGTETLLSQRNLSSAASILSGEIDQDGQPDNNVIHVVILDNISTPFVLDGFTIRDGYSNIVLPLIHASGTGILVVNCTEYAVRIRNCIIRNNVGKLGAAITNVNSNPIYINCVVTGNTTTLATVLFGMKTSSPAFFNCSIANNAITGNDFIVIRNTGSSIPLIINSIVRGTSPAMDGGTPDVANSLVQNVSVFPGGGNVAGDPMFVNEAAGDLHLRSGSPAINSGSDFFNSESGDIEGNNRKIGVIDMGAYEFQSSTPACTAVNLTTTTLTALQTSGCGTAAIASVTFAYSTTPVTLTAAQYATLNLSIAEGSCAIATVEYTDAINQALSAPGKIVVVRTFTVTDVNHATATATQQIKVVDATAPTV
jgi:hypothetical protein